MIVLHVEQGSPEWFEARLGIPTASSFNKLVTPTGKPSTQLAGYANELAAEVATGHEEGQFDTYYTARGRELEGQARAWFEFHTDLEVTQVGFVLRDDREVGCSPDGLTEFGGLEIKCPKADKHVGFMLSDELPSEYIAQVQGNLWLCERDTWNFVSFHPELPGRLITVGRDEQYIKTLEAQVAQLIDRKMKALETLLAAA